MGDLLIAACTLIQDKVQKSTFNRERMVQGHYGFVSPLLAVFSLKVNIYRNLLGSTKRLLTHC